jgi:hypothetical protein
VAAGHGEHHPPQVQPGIALAQPGAPSMIPSYQPVRSVCPLACSTRYEATRRRFCHSGGGRDLLARTEEVPQLRVLGRWQLVGAATNVPGQVAGTAAPVVAALDGLDATHPDRPAVALAHHPLRSPSTHEWFTFSDGDVLAQRLLGRAAPAVLLSGHTHQPYEKSIGAARLLGAPSTLYGLRHAGDSWTVDVDLTGARIIDLHPDATIATHVAIC